VFCEDGNEGSAESAFAKEASKQVWNLKGNGKGIPNHACTKDTGAYHVPCKTKYSA